MRDRPINADDHNRAKELYIKEQILGKELTDAERFGEIVVHMNGSAEGETYEESHLRWELTFGLGKCCLIHRKEFEEGPKKYKKKFKKEAKKINADKNHIDKLINV